MMMIRRFEDYHMTTVELVLMHDAAVEFAAKIWHKSRLFK